MESERQEEEVESPPRKKQHLSAATLAESEKARALKDNAGVVSGSSFTGTSSSSSGRESSGCSNNGSAEGSSSSPDSDDGGSGERSGPAATAAASSTTKKKGPNKNPAPSNETSIKSTTCSCNAPSKKRAFPVTAKAEAPQSSPGKPPVFYRADGKKHVEKNSLTEEALIEDKLRVKNSNKDKAFMTEVEKRDERRTANRLSAFQSRQRRKIVIEDLQKTVAALSKDNSSQRAELSQLRHQLKLARQENQDLRTKNSAPMLVGSQNVSSSTANGVNSNNLMLELLYAQIKNHHQQQQQQPTQTHPKALPQPPPPQQQQQQPIQQDGAPNSTPQGGSNGEQAPQDVNMMFLQKLAALQQGQQQQQQQQQQQSQQQHQQQQQSQQLSVLQQILQTQTFQTPAPLQANINNNILLQLQQQLALMSGIQQPHQPQHPTNNNARNQNNEGKSER